MKNETTPNLQDLWERGIERATADKSTLQELGDAKLGEVAGLQIKSGLESGGLWGSTSCSCQAGCTNICHEG